MAAMTGLPTEFRADADACFDIARTMGARTWFLVPRVAVPAAMPAVFVG